MFAVPDKNALLTNLDLHNVIDLKAGREATQWKSASNN